jgi:citronellol/citronellal dehydrogenase
MSERKVALVTGGGSGIGEASALELARNGSDVVLVDVRQPEIERVAGDIRALGREALPIVCDVSDDVAMAAAFSIRCWSMPGSMACGRRSRR